MKTGNPFSDYDLMLVSDGFIEYVIIIIIIARYTTEE